MGWESEKSGLPAWLDCNILTFDPAVNQETGASGRRYQDITLTVDGFEFGAIVTPTGRRWVSNNYITLCHSRSQLVGVRVAVRGSENQLSAEVLGPQNPRLSSPAERSAAIVRGTWGQYVAVCSVSNSPLTQNPFAFSVRGIFF